MALTVHTSATIRGVTYEQGDPFVCAYSAKGNGGSEGDGTSAAALEVGKTYYFLAYVTAADSGSNVVYPYRVGSSSSTGSAIGYYKAEVFPYATYRVTFNANGGSLGNVPSYQTKTHGTALELTSAKPTRSGYTFVGWGTSDSDTTANYNPGDNYTANAGDILYAIWKKTITLTYNANGGSGAPSSQSATIYNATTSNKFTLSSTKPTLTGHTFLGWSKSNTATSSSYDAGGSITLSDSDTLYAVWRDNKLNIRFHANGGSISGSEKYYLNNNLVSLISSSEVFEQEWTYDNTKENGLSNASTFGLSRTGYTFKGWKLGSSGTTVFDQDNVDIKPTNITSDIKTKDCTVTLYAVWEVNSYTYNIVYKSSSVQLGTATITKDYGTTNTVSPKSFTGYTSPSSQSVKWDSTSAKTITFTYTPITYDVTINCNGGSGVSSRTYTIETATFSLGTPTRTGYTFNGWTGSNGTTAQKTVSIAKGSTGNKSYTAQWTVNKLTVNYYSNYATSAFSGAANTVGSDKNVVVLTGVFDYDGDYSEYGLANYSGSSGSAYMTRTGYKPTGNWGTSTSGGNLISEAPSDYATGQDIAKKLGKDLSNGSTSVNVYAQWTENKLTLNYYSNYADYGTFEGSTLNVSANTNVPVHSQEYLYDNEYVNGLYNVQNSELLYLSRTGYKPTGYWGTSSDGGNLINEAPLDYSTGQDIAVKLGKTLANGDVSVNIYPQWKPSGVVYIDNGTKLEAYLPYIDNGTSWDIYLAYVDNGTSWNIIS